MFKLNPSISSSSIKIINPSPRLEKEYDMKFSMPPHKTFIINYHKRKKEYKD